MKVIKLKFLKNIIKIKICLSYLKKKESNRTNKHFHQL